MTKDVADYYNLIADAEHNRLDLPLCRIEFESTVRLIEKYFPLSGSVCDIGGGTGRYTAELLGRGYTCRLVDLSEREIEIAKTHFRNEVSSKVRAEIGDATDLFNLGTNEFDAGLLMGPMYHITQTDLRKRALQEFHRILKPNAIGIIAFINSWGLLKSGINDFPSWFHREGFADSLLGTRSFTQAELTGFTECYWTTPMEAQKELEREGFEILSYAGAESFASGMANELSEIQKKESQLYRRIVKEAAKMAELKQFRDSTDHIHFVVRKMT